MVWDDRVTDEDPIVGCTACGTTVPRSEMFGLEPDLLCSRCASGVRRRMHVRFRPIARDRKPRVTLAVIGIAVVIFVLDEFLFTWGQFVRGQSPAWWEAVFLNMHVGPRLWDGHVWTLLGACFFHGDWIHLLFNCWWIWELGRATENGFGHLTLIAVVIGGGMVASGLEWVINGPGIGLSGVVYALAFFLWAHHRTNPSAAAIMNRRTINFLTMWFFLCIVLTMTGTWRIANWAHGGGALWGWGFGLALLHAKRKQLVPAAAVATIVLVAAMTFVTFGKQTDLKAADARAKAAQADHHTRYLNYMVLRTMADRAK
ncbi:MAG: rhomboid family intramembrane serine protease [Planctomycetota bacterium]|nr:rhomboid family intramembrane serine protease [Planctomycetota bacterium]